MLLRFIDVTAKNSRQMLDNVNWTHLVLASCKLVPQKTDPGWEAKRMAPKKQVSEKKYLGEKFFAASEKKILFHKFFLKLAPTRKKRFSSLTSNTNFYSQRTWRERERERERGDWRGGGVRVPWRLRQKVLCRKSRLWDYFCTRVDFSPFFWGGGGETRVRS